MNSFKGIIIIIFMVIFIPLNSIQAGFTDYFKKVTDTVNQSETFQRVASRVNQSETFRRVASRVNQSEAFQKVTNALKPSEAFQKVNNAEKPPEAFQKITSAVKPSAFSMFQGSKQKSDEELIPLIDGIDDRTDDPIAERECFVELLQFGFPPMRDGINNYLYAWGKYIRTNMLNELNENSRLYVKYIDDQIKS
ncbi:Hypothetical protein CINCED_3A000878, partial [Cinara cedri]